MLLGFRLTRDLRRRGPKELGTLVCLVGSQFGVYAQQQSTQNQSPPYKLLRYDEDYSYLKDPTRRTDIWDPVKYIPLGSREGWYLSLGGEMRLRYEFFN